MPLRRNFCSNKVALINPMANSTSAMISENQKMA
ncbi:hypothetical protein PD885_00251 [Xanthomonas fragariae]|uniref:Uncharacterized protein n=1 Tax=Xanthomonas fragariae TaxID=48664 RepID=A0ABY1RJS6_9XANT|nr:hypothetical protein PD885_00251 [Xanthomonas fragariae]